MAPTCNDNEKSNNNDHKDINNNGDDYDISSNSNHYDGYTLNRITFGHHFLNVNVLSCPVQN